MGKRCNQESGFTLVEVLIVLAVMGIVSTAIYNVHITGWKTWKFNQTQLNLYQEGRIAIMKMVKKIKGAVEAKGQDGVNWPKKKLVIKVKENNDGTSDYLRFFNSDDLSNPNLDPHTLYFETASGTDWPSSSDWGRATPITTKILKDINFIGSDSDSGDSNDLIDVVEINLVFSDEPGNSTGKTYLLKNKVHFRNSE